MKMNRPDFLNFSVSPNFVVVTTTINYDDDYPTVKSGCPHYPRVG